MDYQTQSMIENKLTELPHVQFNKNKSFTITHNGKRITLSELTINTLLKEKNIILTALKTGKHEVKIYEKDAMYISIKKTINLSSCKLKVEAEFLLHLTKNNTTIILNKDNYVHVMSMAISLRKLEQSPWFKPDHYYRLTEAKKIKIESDDNTFTISNDHDAEKFATLPLCTLEHIVKMKKEIFNDLVKNDRYKRRSYWSDQNCEVYTNAYLTFRILCFISYITSSKISIKLSTFERIIDILGQFFGEEYVDDDLSEDESDKFGEKIPINGSKTVEFSNNLKEFFLTSITDDRRQELRLPIAALDALVDNENKILLDLQNDSVSTVSGRDYINEYWCNDKYAIRTARFIREKTNKVLRFESKPNNSYVIVIQEKSFSRLLKIYDQQKNQVMKMLH